MDTWETGQEINLAAQIYYLMIYDQVSLLRWQNPLKYYYFCTAKNDFFPNFKVQLATVRRSG